MRLQKLANVLHRLMEPRYSGVPLAIFRIVFCVICLANLYELIYFRQLFFDFIPFAEPNPVRMGSVLLVWSLVVFMLLIGFRTRFAALANLACAIVILGFARGDYVGTQAMMLLRGSWLLLLLPVSKRLSVDRVAQRCSRGTLEDDTGQVPAIVPVVFAVLISWTYLDSGLWKLDSPMWRAGLGVWAPATLPHAILRPVPFMDSEFVMRLSGYGVIAFELTFGLLFLIRTLRPWLIMLAVVFHIGIAIFYPIPIFSLCTAALLLPLVPASLLQKAGQLIRREKPPVTAVYNPIDPAHRFLHALVTSFDLRGSVTWQASSANASAVPANAVNVTFEHTRLSEVRQILGSVTLLAPLSFLLARSAYLRDTFRSVAGRSLNRAAAVRTFDAKGVSFRELGPALLVLVLVTICLTITAGAGADPRDPRGRWSLFVMRTVYPYTGLRHHRVFADRLFEGYDYQLNLVHESAAGRTLLPFHTIDGFESYSISNRAWELWWKETEAPYVSTQQAERNLLRWVQFFSQAGYDLEDASVAIEARPQKVQLTAWKAGLLDENLAQPWLRIGTIRKVQGGREAALELLWNLSQDSRSGQNVGELLADTVHASLAYHGEHRTADVTP